MHLFGFVGMLLAGGGIVINAYLSVLWLLGHGIGQRPLLLLGMLLTITGVLAALAVIGSTLPLLGRITGPEVARND